MRGLRGRSFESNARPACDVVKLCAGSTYTNSAVWYRLNLRLVTPEQGRMGHAKDKE